MALVTLEGLVYGDWVEIESPYGLEGGQVTVSPELLTIGGSPELYGCITKRLDSSQIARVAQLADEAQTILPRLVEDIRHDGGAWVITGLRFTLQPERAIISWQGDANGAIPDDSLRQHLQMPYILEHDDAVEHSHRLYGGLGRLVPQASSIEAIIHQRFEPAGSTSLPAGYPRLSSRVMTSRGAGTVVSVSTKHRRATVKLTEDDTEQFVPLGELQVIDWPE